MTNESAMNIHDAESKNLDTQNNINQDSEQGEDGNESEVEKDTSTKIPDSILQTEQEHTEATLLRNAAVQMEFEQADTLLELGLEDDLYFTMSYQSVLVNKKGIIAKLKNHKEQLDIDIACALYDENNVLQDVVWYKKLRDSSEAIRHFGDELQGIKKKITEPVVDITKNQTDDKATNTTPDTNNEKSHENVDEIDKPAEKKKKKPRYRYNIPERTELETIHLNLKTLPDNITHIALLISSFQQIPMSVITEGSIELKDVEGNSALYFDFSSVPKECTSFWLASLERNTTSTWKFLKKEQPLPHRKIDIQAENLLST